jgi:putative DNA primase/helicase
MGLLDVSLLKPRKPIDLHEYLRQRGHDVEAIIRECEDEDKRPAPPAPPSLSTRDAANGSTVSTTPNNAALTQYAATALSAECNAIRSASSGNRNHTLNESAFKLYSLVGSGVLDRSTVEREIAAAARSIGLDDQEITKTLGSASKGIGSPRDLSGVGQGVGRMDFERYSEAVLGGGVLVVGDDGQTSLQVTNGTVSHTENHNANATETSTASCPPGLEDSPHRLAQLFARRVNHPDGLRLQFWRDRFYWWDGCAYREIPEKEIRAEVTNFIAGEMLRLHRLALMAYGMRQASNSGDGGEGGGGGGSGSGKGPPKPIHVTTSLVNNVLQALSGIALLTARDVPEQPAWIAGAIRPEWPAKEVLPARNALIHLPSLVIGNHDAVIDPTPTFFSTIALSYDYQRAAQPPTNWTAFLDQIWQGDQEAIDTLQEWMGFLLIPDTSIQKILMLTGPPRSGKGTICKVIESLVGDENVVNPTLNSLTTQFGLEPLIGKSVAIITDARVDRHMQTTTAVERLLSISGNDKQSVSRKMISTMDSRLATRFMIVSNLVPQLQDPSGAIASRMIFLNLKAGFLGREVRNLAENLLLPELPGILRWAIEGWARLRERGHFIQPESGMAEKESMEDMASPISEFVKECCEIGNDDMRHCVSRGEMFAAWQAWCQSQGIGRAGNQSKFGRDLRSVVPNLTNFQHRIGGRPVRYYGRIRLVDGVGQPVQGVQPFMEELEDEQGRNNAREYSEHENYMEWGD